MFVNFNWGEVLVSQTDEDFRAFNENQYLDRNLNGSVFLI